MSPFELADYLAAAAALTVGVFIGRRGRPKPPEPIRPICSCRHGLGTHEDGRKCQGSVPEASRYNYAGVETAWKQVPCPCTRYDGPDPVIFGLEAHR